jgi:hypothetical protein
MSETTDGKLRFHLQNVDPDADEATVERLVEEAMDSAIAAAGGKADVDAKLQPEGRFLGVGETVIVLWILHALKVGGVAFGTGAAAEAGKHFYNDFLAPELRKRNLLPTKLEEIAPGKKTGAP